MPSTKLCNPTSRLCKTCIKAISCPTSGQRDSASEPLVCDTPSPPPEEDSMQQHLTPQELAEHFTLLPHEQVLLVPHHSEFDGRSLYRVQSGQPIHRRMTSDAPEK